MDSLANCENNHKPLVVPHKSPRLIGVIVPNLQFLAHTPIKPHLSQFLIIIRDRHEPFPTIPEICIIRKARHAVCKCNGIICRDRDEFAAADGGVANRPCADKKQDRAREINQRNLEFFASQPVPITIYPYDNKRKRPQKNRFIKNRQPKENAAQIYQARFFALYSAE